MKKAAIPKKPDQFIWREDGRREWKCPKHGIGHTIAIPVGIKEKDKWAWWSHGCCGCCSKISEL